MIMGMGGARLACAATCSVLMAAFAGAPRSMEIQSTTPLDGVKGRIDHLAADLARHRLFVAALGNDTLEVTGAGEHRSVRGFEEPQGVAYVAETNRLFVANGRGARVDILDASSLAVLQKIDGLDDADNVRYDAVSKTVIVGYGEGALALIDAREGKLVARIALPGHPESFQLEHGGARVFVNVPSARKVVVVDRVRRQVVASWHVTDAQANFPMALDEGSRRLFVGARSPAVMLVFDIDTGKVVARVPIGGDTDDIGFDAGRKRLYVVCGEGRIDVVRQDSPDRYTMEESIPTAPRARTGLWVPEEDTLYVAAPATFTTPARILAFRPRRSP